MHRLTALFAVLAVCGMLAACNQSTDGNSGNADAATLPQGLQPTALDFGDSVSIGYAATARFLMYDKVDLRHNPWFAGAAPIPTYLDDQFLLDVHAAAINDGYSTTLLQNMEQELGAEDRYSVILMNSGLHDLQYENETTGHLPNVSLALYRENLEAAAQLAEQHADHVIWVDTTPVQDDLASSAQQYGVPDNAQVPYNQVAQSVAREHGFYILDMGTTLGMLPNDVHYSKIGYMNLGERITDCVLYVLNDLSDQTAQQDDSLHPTNSPPPRYFLVSDIPAFCHK